MASALSAAATMATTATTMTTTTTTMTTTTTASLTATVDEAPTKVGGKRARDETDDGASRAAKAATLLVDAENSAANNAVH